MKVLQLFVIVALICALSVEVAALVPKGPVFPSRITPSRKLDVQRKHPFKDENVDITKRRDITNKRGDNDEEEIETDSNHGICPETGVGNGVVSWFLNPETFEGEFYYSGDDGLGYLSYECTMMQDNDMIHAFRVKIGEGFSTIGMYAFSGFENLVFVDLPKSLQEIEPYAFAESPNVGALTIPDDVYYLGEGCFMGTDLRSVTIPEGVQAIDSYAFADCHSLHTVTFVGEIEREIGTAAFNGCESLRSVTLDGVVSLGEEAFSGCVSLQEVTIPSSMTAIDVHAFFGCSSLTAFSVDENELFYEDGGVLIQKFEGEGDVLLAYPMAKTEESYVIPEGVISIAPDAFYGCEYLKSISLAETVVSIDDGDYGFLTGCNSLTSVSVPEGHDKYLDVGGVLFEKQEEGDKRKLVRYPPALEQEEGTYQVDGSVVDTIGLAAFRGSNALEKIVLSSGIVTIGDYAFSETSLHEVSIADTVTSIGERAFSSSPYLTEMEVPGSVESLGPQVFASCSGLKSVKLSSGALTKIPSKAFYGCSGLETIVIPDGVTTIFTGAFSYCNSLTQVNISKSVDKIYDGENEVGENGFLWPCASLTSINVDEDNTKFVSKDGVLFEKKENEKLKLVRYPQALKQDDDTYVVNGSQVDEVGFAAFKACNALKKVVLSEGVTTIDPYAFSRTTLVTFEFPEHSLSVIKEDAFFRSYDLTGVVIPQGASIEKEAFFACKGLKSVTLPSDLTAIPDGAFEECLQLESVYIPDLVTKIGDTAFKFCESMTDVRLPPELETIGDAAFEECVSLKSVVIPNSTTEIGQRAFMYCSQLEEVTLPQNDGCIIDFIAFIFCTSLTELYIPANIIFGQVVFEVDTGIQKVTFEEGRTEIPYGLFYGCTGLTEIYIPDSVTTIEDYAFGLCTNILSLHISENVISIGSYAFYGYSFMESLVIPEKTELIGEGAFADWFNLAHVSIPNSVKKIKTLAFAGCRNLRSVTMNEGLEKIGLQCFMGCSRLVNVSLPSTLTYIGDYAFMDCLSLEHEEHTVEGKMKYFGVGVFKGCKNLVSVTVPPAIEAVPAELFSQCSSLKSVTLPDTVEVIGESAFNGCSNMTTIDWPEGIHEIGVEAFAECSSLKQLNIPESVTAIGDRAFKNCSGVAEVTISSGMNTLGDFIFDGCSNLTTLTIPGSISTIGEYAFAGMSSLMRIVVEGEGSDFYTLEDGALYSREGQLIRVPQGFEGTFVVPDDVTSISGAAFSGCRNLEVVNISARVISIGVNAFDDLPKLQSIHVLEGNSVFAEDDGVLFSFDGKTLIRYPGGKKGEYDIPTDTEEVSNFAFYSCGGLTKVTIPGSVKSIGNYSFSKCGDLSSAILSDGVGTIMSNAFEGCSKLQNVEIPSSVESIGENSFHGCSLLSDIKLSNGLRSIYSHAFVGCDPKNVTIPSSVEEIGESIFDECYNLVRIDVEEGSEYFSSANGALMDAFGNLVQFPKGFAGRFELPLGVRRIDSKAFNGCIGLTEIYIPPSVESIGTKPFAGCKNLQSIIVDDENANYGAGVASLFELYYLIDFRTLTLIDYPEGRGGEFVANPYITLSIGAKAFQGNKGLTSVEIPEGMMAIDDNAFEGCESLKDVKIGSTVTFIGDYVFAGCYNLATIDYRGVKNPCDKVNNHTLEGTTNLRVVVLSDDYDENDDTFCGTIGFCLAESVEALNLRNNMCIEENCHIGHKLNRTTDAAKKWKAKSNACADFICHEDLGPLQWSMCNKSSDGQSYMCINDGCLPVDQPMIIEITMEGIQAGDFDISSMKQEVAACSGYEISEAGYELGDNAYIVRVIIVIEDETVGQTIVEAINNELEKGTGCQYRTLCRGKYARLIVSSLELSEARTNHIDLMLSIFAILATIMAFFH